MVENIEAGRTGNWSQKDPELVGSRIPSRQKPILSEEIVAAARNWDTAYDYYKLFQPDSFADHVVEQSILYAGQHDMQKAAAAVDRDIYR